MYVVVLVVLGVFFLISTYNFLPLMLLLTSHLVSGIIETKNRTLEETGTLYDGDSGEEPVVSATHNITEEDERPSQIFHVYIRD